MNTMKTLLIASLASVLSGCIGQSNNRQELKEITLTTQANDKTVEVGQVAVLVFHGVRQCETCKAIKKNAEEVVDSLITSPTFTDKVVYRVVDFSKPENKALANKYEIAWTSLLLVKRAENGKETVNNISEFAIENSRTNTPAFRQQLAAEIAALLR